MILVAAFVIIWTFSVSSNCCSADLSFAGSGVYFLMPDVNSFVTTDDLNNGLHSLQNHTCQFVPLDWSVRQHISQLHSSSEEGVAVELVGEHVTVVELISAQPKPTMGKSQF